MAVDAWVKPSAPSQESCGSTARQGSAVVRTSRSAAAASPASQGADTVLRR